MKKMNILVLTDYFQFLKRDTKNPHIIYYNIYIYIY